mgnify:CR=1 FL=1
MNTRNKPASSLMPVTIKVTYYQEDGILVENTKTLYTDGICNSTSTGKLIGYIQACHDHGHTVEIIHFDQQFKEVDDLLMDWIVSKMPLPEDNWEAEVTI